MSAPDWKAISNALAKALSDLMGTESGEPDYSDPLSITAWEEANVILADYQRAASVPEPDGPSVSASPDDYGIFHTFALLMEDGRPVHGYTFSRARPFILAIGTGESPFDMNGNRIPDREA